LALSKCEKVFFSKFYVDLTTDSEHIVNTRHHGQRRTEWRSAGTGVISRL